VPARDARPPGLAWFSEALFWRRLSQAVPRHESAASDLFVADAFFWRIAERESRTAGSLFGAWAAEVVFLSQTPARDVIDLDVQPRRRRASAHDESGAGLGERGKVDPGLTGRQMSSMVALSRISG